MKIVTLKIPVNMKNLPLLVDFINKNGTKFLNYLIADLEKLEGYPDNSNATYKMIAADLKKEFTYSWINFVFYRSKNPFWGKNVISHATNGNTINYNTRFHSDESFTLVDWLCNYFHEISHLADQRSVYSYDHKDQSQYNAAPMVVSRMARVIYLRHESEWL